MISERFYEEPMNEALIPDNLPAVPAIKGPAHDQIRDFFENHKDFFENYVHDSSVKIRPAEGAMARAVKTFAIDLAHGEIFVNPDFFVTREPDEAVFATLHEYEHVRELRELLGDVDGVRIWQRHIRKIGSGQRFKILDNCIDDIKMNRTVLDRAPVLEQTRNGLYAKDLFPDEDITNEPKHLQFSYALLQRTQPPGRSVIVAPEVQAELDALDAIKHPLIGQGLLDYATAPETHMAMRIKLQEHYLYPALERLFEKDVEDANENERGSEGGSGEGEVEEGEGGSGDKTESGEPEQTQSKQSKNPEDYFKDSYSQYDEKHPQAISTEDIKEAVKKYIEFKKNEKTTEQMMDEVYARAQGVTVEELNDYRQFWREIAGITNPETNQAVVEELRALFRQIIAERRKPVPTTKLPDKEGEILAYPAEAVAAVRAGVQDPEVWQTLENQEKLRELCGDFDVTLLCDRSASMVGAKATEQRKTAALLLEALEEFSQLLTEERADLAHNLNVRTECWSFGDEEQVEVLKPLSHELSEKERVHVYKKLADTSGKSTRDFSALEKIFGSIGDEDRVKIEQGKLRKIIIVLSDGQSDDVGRVQAVLSQYRELGAKVVGVGITVEGQPIEQTYAPDGQTCENVRQLPSTIGALLKECLGTLNA